MIKIEIPNADYTVKLENYNEIPFDISGVYIFYDSEGIPLYVGQAMDLRRRIHAHYRGQSGNNTQRYAWAFYQCKVFIESDAASRNIYECYFINFLKPPLNKNINPHKYEGHNFLLDKAEPKNLHPAYCSFILDNGRQCLRRPHINGFCSLHGGNGISRQSYIDNAIDEYEKQVEMYHDIERGDAK